MNKKTPILVALAKEMRQRGWRYIDISRLLGVDPTVVHGWVDPDYADRRLQQNRECQRRRRTGRRSKSLNVVKNHTQAAVDAGELIRLIPRDTRDLTARLCGDPLPGRRAIDQVEMARGKYEVPFQ